MGGSVTVKRPFIICAAVIVAAILIFAGLGRAGIIDMNKHVVSVPAGAVPHGGAEKPIADQMAGSK
jgi:hypothetical protein